MARDVAVEIRPRPRTMTGFPPTREIPQMPPVVPGQEPVAPGEETAGQRTEQRRGFTPEQLAETIADQAQSGELLAKARPTPTTVVVTLPKSEHPDLAEDQAGDRVDMLASGTVRNVDEQGNVAIDIDSASVIHGAFDKEQSGHTPSARRRKLPGRLGAGTRFAALQRRIAGRKGFKPREPGQTKEEAAGAIAASVGRKKFGKKRFQQLGLRGRLRRARGR